jgi:hypothetical protein
MNGMRFSLVAAALLFALPAVAQSTRYDVKTLNFDLWCQETARINPDRCDKRLPDDEKQFEAYRAKIEKYEVPYLLRKEKEQQFDQDVLHNDPVGNPIYKDPARQQQLPTPNATGSGQ